MPTDSVYRTLDQRRPLAGAALPRQWILTRHPADVPAGWSIAERSGWFLGAHPDARIFDLRSRSEEPLGWLINPLLQLGPDADHCITDSVTLELSSQPTESEIAAALYGRDSQGHTHGTGIEGMWTAILLPDHDGGWVYLSAANTVVFSSTHGVVAATPSAIRELHRDEGLTHLIDPLGSGRYFPFGLTPFREVRRLLPGHRLSLTTLAADRHWPATRLPTLPTGAYGAAQIADHGRRTVRALCTGYTSMFISLTAGADSRAVLAMSRDAITAEDVSFRIRTLRLSERLSARTDVHTSQRLARLVEVRAEISAPQPPSPQAIETAFLRIGEAKTGTALSAPTSDPSGIELKGLAGEIGRAKDWPVGVANATSDDAGVQPEVLLRQVGAPIHPRLAEEATRWLQELPAGLPAGQLLSLSHLENRFGCWAAPEWYLRISGSEPIAPMASTKCVELMVRLPTEYKLAGQLQHDVIEHAWPELLRLPINRPTGRLAVEASLRRRVRRMRGT